MKKLHLLILAGVALVAVSVYAYEQVRRDAQGLHIGSAVTDRIGMWGATPVVRQTITNTAPVLATLTVSSATITYAGVDGSTNSISVVTNVAINAIAGYSGTNQLNQLRNALVNVGIASTTGQ
jgi:hypothetical protein